MQITKNRRNALFTGVATLAVAGSATLAFALPGGSTNTEATAATVAASSAASSAAAEAQQSALAKADADAKAAAKAQADAAAKVQADAQAKADADAKAAADAKAQADAAAKAKADAKAQADAQAKADAKAQADADAAASRSQQRSDLSAVSGSPQEIAAQIVPAGQLDCFSNIVERESGWNVTATNPSSGAYGLVQSLPASKMASAGSDWRTNAATQIKWGLNYMNEAYGSPCGAWSFWQSHSAY